MTIAEIIAGAKVVMTTVVAVKKFSDVVVKPLIDKMDLESKRKLVVAERIDIHLKSRLKKYRMVDTIVSPVKVDLLQIYTALTISQGEGGRSYLIDNFSTSIFNFNAPKVIVDSAGMGKSTILKYLYLTCIKEYGMIPFIVELRKLKKDQSIEDYIAKDISNTKISITEAEIQSLILSGGIVLLLDGVDEVDKIHTNQVIDNINKIVEDNEKNRIIVTSRQLFNLNELYNFEFYSINPLSKDQSIELLVRYGMKNRDTVDRLIAEVNIRYQEISHLLSNPLTTSLLFRAYQYKSYIPLKNSNFYRQVYDALFESHDLSKGGGYRRKKSSNLDIDEFYRVCRLIGFICYKKGIIEAERDEFINIINQAKKYSPEIHFKASEFLDDISSAVPFFARDGNYYRWVHKSFQEYFAAQALYTDFRDKSGDVLFSIFKNPDRKHENFLSFYYEIDTNGYNIHILSNLLEEYIQYTKSIKLSYDSIGLNEELYAGFPKARSFSIHRRYQKLDGWAIRNGITSQIKSEMLNVMSVNSDLVLITALYPNDMFWDIARRGGAKYVTFDHTPTPEESIAKIYSIIDRSGVIGWYGNEINLNFKASEIKHINIYLKNNMLREININQAKMEIENSLEALKADDDLFTF